MVAIILWAKCVGALIWGVSSISDIDELPRLLKSDKSWNL